MEIKQAFQIILQVREKFVGTKQEQITVDQALQSVSEQLFPKPVKTKAETKAESKHIKN